ncbi:MAG TPA: ABC transporter substrate-binding protein, partial [Candidatus Binatia bacterium]
MRLFIRIAALIALFQLAAGPLHAQELKRIRIGYPSLSFRQSNVWVAKEMGLFKKYGLEVEPIFLRGGQIATQALAG